MSANQTLRELAERKSIRVFADAPIGETERAAILEAAVQAPTAGNQQLYTILEITDPDIKAQLADSCDHQPFIAAAPMVLIFIADAQKWYDAYRLAGLSPRKPGAGDLLLAADDALIAAQNAVTAAWSLGIGSCYIGDIMERAEFHRELMALPEYAFPAAMVVFGYPASGKLPQKKPPRCDMDLIVRENAYRRMSEEELRRMAERRTGDASYEEWMRAFCNRKYDSDFSREMTRSVEKWLEPFLKK